MGDRRQAVLHYSNGSEIYVYVHWHGSDLPVIVALGLERSRTRWDDEPYLTRGIISTVIAHAADDTFGPTGVGVAPYRMDTEYEDIHVFLHENEVQVGAERLSFEDFIVSLATYVSDVPNEEEA